MRNEVNSDEPFEDNPRPLPHYPPLPEPASFSLEDDDEGEPDAFDTEAEDAEDEDAAPSLFAWKEELRREFESWLDAIDALPEPEADEPPDAPDLYSFYEQLAAATAEARKGNRRTAEAFSQWAGTLGHFEEDVRLLRQQLAATPVPAGNALPRAYGLAFIEIFDRMERLTAAFDTGQPKKRWLSRDAAWRQAWQNQRQGFAILLSHVQGLLQQAGAIRIQTVGLPFDPGTMSAVAAVPTASAPPQTVIEELAPGYRLNGELLRVAQVKIAAPLDEPDR